MYTCLKTRRTPSAITILTSWCCDRMEPTISLKAALRNRQPRHLATGHPGRTDTTVQGFFLGTPATLCALRKSRSGFWLMTTLAYGGRNSIPTDRLRSHRWSTAESPAIRTELSGWCVTSVLPTTPDKQSTAQGNWGIILREVSTMPD